MVSDYTFCVISFALCLHKIVFIANLFELWLWNFTGLGYLFWNITFIFPSFDLFSCFSYHNSHGKNYVPSSTLTTSIAQLLKPFFLTQQTDGLYLPTCSYGFSNRATDIKLYKGMEGLFLATRLVRVCNYTMVNGICIFEEWISHAWESHISSVIQCDLYARKCPVIVDCFII